MIDEALKCLDALLGGQIPKKLAISENAPPEEAALAAAINKVVGFIGEIYEMALPLAQGDLDSFKPSSGNFLASPLKALHANLLHLTWQTTRVAQGDYNQRVDFMGNFSDAFNHMIIALDENEKALRAKIGELEQALTRITKLERVLQICSSCKKIRAGDGDPHHEKSWVELERYFGNCTETRFSHSLCPDCLAKMMAD